ncbi:MAG: hypothetical protein KAT53_00900 [Dehalococcoidia bacterium]|nr:hypothetical protein [Dehalococcoidia bacterium]
MPENEKPLIHIDHRIYHDEPKVILSVFDLEDIPEKVEFSIQILRGFDDVLQEFRRPPSKWLNHWAKLDYGEPVPVLFDAGGHPYIMAPAKQQETAPLLNAIVAGLKGTKPIEVKVLIHEENFGEIIERLETATDFCDYCTHPLPKNCNSWLEHDGASIADVYMCPSCESESIRWDREFIEEHPSLEGLDLRTR